MIELNICGAIAPMRYEKLPTRHHLDHQQPHVAIIHIIYVCHRTRCQAEAHRTTHAERPRRLRFPLEYQVYPLIVYSSLAGCVFEPFVETMHGNLSTGYIIFRGCFRSAAGRNSWGCVICCVGVWWTYFGIGGVVWAKRPKVFVYTRNMASTLHATNTHRTLNTLHMPHVMES